MMFSYASKPMAGWLDAAIADGLSFRAAPMPETASLAVALVQLQAALPRITKDDRGQAGNRETRYANLATITDAIKPVLADHGFAWICRPTFAVDRFILHYQLLHAPTGDSISGEYPLPQQANSQSIGGAITYAKRYALCAVLNIAPAEDDDDAQADAQEHADRQRMRTRAVADEGAHTPPPHARPAERSKGRLPDDEWTTPAPGEPSTNAQWQAIVTLTKRLGAASDHDRHALIGQALGTGELIGATKLSAQQASDVIKYLQDQIGTDR
jgi:ERF superfamily